MWNWIKSLFGSKEEKNEGPDFLLGIRSKGWRQGSVISDDMMQRLISDKVLILPPDIHTESFLVVISQDCDVVQLDLSKEPYVEVLVVCPTVTTNGNYCFGKNPRIYQFSDPDHSNRSKYNINIHNRMRLPREYLNLNEPDAKRNIEPDTIRQIAHWVARRYTRIAFPDKFNERIRPVASEVQKIMKKGSQYIKGLYVDMKLEDLTEDENYDIVLWATMGHEDYDDPDKRASALDTIQKVESNLGNCKGIQVDSSVIGEHEMSLDQRNGLYRMDFDHITLRNETGSKLPMDD